MTKNDISNEGRYTIIDVAKAIGIISVMFGHACTELPITHLRIARFVYFYHLMIFFFVAGFCFNEEKTMQNPSKPIGKRLTNIVIPFVIYNTIYVLLHNTFVGLSILKSDKYVLTDIVSNIARGIVLKTSERFLSPFWFLVPLFFTTVMFTLIFIFSNKVLALTKSRIIKRVVEIISISVLGCIGLYLCSNDIQLDYRVQIAYLSIPVMYLGFIVKTYYNVVSKCFFRVGVLISMLI